MSKLFCEICGTAYSDTATECPICGSPKPEGAEFAADIRDSAAEEIKVAPVVKGGRFSKSNVSKRMKAEGNTSAEAQPKKKNKNKKKGSRADRGLVIAIILLLIAIFVVVGYIVVRYFLPKGSTAKPSDNGASSAVTTETVPQTSQNTLTTAAPTTQPAEIHCTGLSVSEDYIRMNQQGGTWQMNVIITPANSTDTLTFLTSDENIVTVSESGLITAVGDGQCTVTVICGDQVIECVVKCDLAPAPEVTEPQETEPDETQPEETEPNETQPEETKPNEPAGGEFKFNTKYKNDKFGSEVTLSRAGEVWIAYAGDIDPTQVQWSVKNTSIARVSADGKVTAVGSGYTVLTAVYNGVEYTCLICCDF